MVVNFLSRIQEKILLKNNKQQYSTFLQLPGSQISVDYRMRFMLMKIIHTSASTISES